MFKTAAKYTAGFIFAGIFWDIIEDVQFKRQLHKRRTQMNQDAEDINRSVIDLTARLQTTPIIHDSTCPIFTYNFCACSKKGDFEANIVRQPPTLDQDENLDVPEFVQRDQASRRHPTDPGFRS